MDRKLQQIYLRAETERKSILEIAAGISEQQFSLQPEGKWSIAQIFAHLITAERSSLQYMKKKSLGINEIDNTGIREDLISIMLTISQRLPLKFKAPKIESLNIPSNLSYSEVKEQWDAARNDLNIFLEKFDDSTIRKKIYKHPFAGRLNIIQAVDFLREHVNHHLPQIKRLL